MAKKAAVKVSIPERLREMKARGIEQVLPGTDRVIRLRSVQAVDLLKEDKMPDILTPLIMSQIYDENQNPRGLRDFTTQDRGGRADALKMVEALDFIAEKSIADDTKVEDLLLSEKKWIFQLALGPAQILANFRSEQEPGVEALAEGDEVQ
jgi:hypothetical protein